MDILKAEIARKRKLLEEKNVIVSVFSHFYYKYDISWDRRLLRCCYNQFVMIVVIKKIFFMSSTLKSVHIVLSLHMLVVTSCV